MNNAKYRHSAFFAMIFLGSVQQTLPMDWYRGFFGKLTNGGGFVGELTNGGRYRLEQTLLVQELLNLFAQVKNQRLKRHQSQCLQKRNKELQWQLIEEQRKLQGNNGRLADIKQRNNWKKRLDVIEKELENARTIEEEMEKDEELNIQILQGELEGLTTWLQIDRLKLALKRKKKGNKSNKYTGQSNEKVKNELKKQIKKAQRWEEEEQQLFDQLQRELRQKELEAILLRQKIKILKEPARRRLNITGLQWKKKGMEGIRQQERYLKQRKEQLQEVQSKQLKKFHLNDKKMARSLLLMRALELMN